MDKFLTKTSNILSGVFSPLLVPVYAFAIALWTTYLVYLPELIRFIACFIILGIVTLVPMGVILFMMRIGKVSDPSISDRNERGIPYIVTILCYFIAAFYLWRWPEWLKMFFVGAAVTAIIDSLINVKWKVSAHTTAMGGLCALVLYITIHQIGTVMALPWLIGVIVLSGAVGSARLYLERHTPAQVYTGWSIGLAVTYLFMSL